MYIQWILSGGIYFVEDIGKCSPVPCYNVSAPSFHGFLDSWICGKMPDETQPEILPASLPIHALFAVCCYYEDISPFTVLKFESIFHFNAMSAGM